jgi:translation initiation factor 2 subunit 1
LLFLLTFIILLLHLNLCDRMNFPDKDEFVVVKVNQILDYGVFVELLEYGKTRGFIHISNVSSSWVKNIRNLVKINQVRVAKVLSTDTEKRQIDLSFAGISPQMEKQKMTDFKQVNREEKLVAILAKQEKVEFDEVWDNIADPLIEEFGSLYKAFEKVALGEDISKIIPKKWVKPVENLVENNIVVSQKVLKGTANAKSINDGGLAAVKKVFEVMSSVEGCSVIYGGAGTYLVSCTAPTFKEAEKVIKESTSAAEKSAKKNNVEFSFKQDEKQK